MFHIGQKVEFVGPDFRSHPNIVKHGIITPVPKQVYTIRAEVLRVEGVGYLLVEIRNELRRCPANGVCEIGIDAHMLRPIVERETDISVFTAMLTSNKVDA